MPRADHHSDSRLQERDLEILADLYFTETMCKEQFLDMGFFTSEGSARQRLWRLGKKGLLRSYKHGAQNGTDPICYQLTYKGHQLVEDVVLDLPERLYPFRRDGRIAASRLEHHLDTVDIYTEIRRAMDSMVGPYPAWQWISERRALRKWHISGQGDRYSRPDAVVLLSDGTRFLIERQTERSKIGGLRLREKLAEHQNYVDLMEDSGRYQAGKTKLYFCCDTKSQADLARIAARDIHLTIPLYAGELYPAAAELVEESVRRLRSPVL